MRAVVGAGPRKMQAIGAPRTVGGPVCFMAYICRWAMQRFTAPQQCTPCVVDIWRVSLSFLLRSDFEGSREDEQPRGARGAQSHAAVRFSLSITYRLHVSRCGKQRRGPRCVLSSATPYSTSLRLCRTIDKWAPHSPLFWIGMQLYTRFTIDGLAYQMNPFVRDTWCAVYSELFFAADRFRPRH